MNDIHIEAFDKTALYPEFDKKGFAYRKKPIVIKAYKTECELYISTLEGILKADKGDYIIKGIQGEVYPCKPDIFEETYELV